MNFLEHAVKPLLAAAGIEVPESQLCDSAETAAAAARRFGPVLVKAQLPLGIGMADAVRPADDPAAAAAAAAALLGRTAAGMTVAQVLVERVVPSRRSFYVAISSDVARKAPVLLFASEGGAIETLAASHPDQVAQLPIDLREGLDEELLLHILGHLGLEAERAALVEACLKLYDAYRVHDAELIEVSRLALTPDGRPVALECRFILDDAAQIRRPALASLGLAPALTELEQAAQDQGLTMIEQAGAIGVLANSPALALVSLDAIRQLGGAPASCLIAGAASYGLGEAALRLVLAPPTTRSLLVNFCGAYARTDLLVEGLIEAWPKHRPAVPVLFTVHGTGEDRAVALLRDRLGAVPFELMDDAVRAAVEAAG